MMRHGLVVSGVLGLGTVLVFGAAALFSLVFPNGASVSAGWNGGGGWANGGMAGPARAPMFEPAVEVPAEK